MPRTERRFVIVNTLGLHARAAAQLVQVANRFRAEIHVEKDGKQVNGKSIMGVLTLAAAKGSSITVRPTARTQSDAPRGAREADRERVRGEVTRDGPPSLVGIAASPGIAIGRCWSVDRRRLRTPKRRLDAGRGRARARAVQDRARALGPAARRGEQKVERADGAPGRRSTPPSSTCTG